MSEEEQQRARDFAQITAQINFEKAQAMKLANVMAMLASVHPFTGDGRMLEGFLQRMDQVQHLIVTGKLEEASVQGLHGAMMAKIEVGLLLDLGLSFKSTWLEAKQRLRTKYRGASKSVSKVGSRLARVTIEPSESLAAFCRRVNDAFRQTKDRVFETFTDTVVAQARVTTYEELAMEALLLALPERLQTLAKTVRPDGLERLIQLVREEEADREDRRRPEYRPNVRTYAEVSRRPPVRLEARTPRARPDHWRAAKPKEEPSRRTSGPQRHAKTLCWECGHEGHLARNCPERGYRRPRQDPPARRDWGEPMEVNAVSRRRDRWPRAAGRNSRDRVESDSSSSGSDDGNGSCSTRSRDGGGNREDSDGHDSAWHRVVRSDRPWRRRKTLKVE